MTREAALRLAALYLAALNLAALCAFGADKRRARRHGRRIPERTLLLLALAGGSLGALCGMHAFHHKTRHRRFRLGLPAILLAHCALAVWLLT